MKSFNTVTTVTTVATATASTTVALSMALNVWAFTAQMDGLFGWIVGLLLPLWVLALTLVGKWGTDTQDRRHIGIAAYVLAGFLLLVSLPHLAKGFDHITGGLWWESWALALVTDMTQVVMKMAVISQAKATVPTAKSKAAKPRLSKAA